MTRPTPQMRSAMLVMAALLLVAPLPRVADAQSTTPSFSIRVPSGGFLPTGEQGRALRNAQVTALQLAWSLRPSLSLTSTFSWANTRNVGAVGTPRLDIFTLDLGLERQLIARGAERPRGYTGFAGLGAGVRNYDQRGPGVGATNSFAGYVSAGGEMRFGRVGLRLEARDYLGNTAAIPGARGGDLRNDIVLLAGVRLVRKR